MLSGVTKQRSRLLEKAEEKSFCSWMKMVGALLVTLWLCVIPFCSSSERCDDWGVDTMKQIQIYDGEPAKIKCPLFETFLKYNYSTAHSAGLTLIWYRIGQDRDLEEPINFRLPDNRISKEKDTLWFWPALLNDTGNYTCMLRNTTYCSKVAFPLEVVPKDQDSCVSHSIKPTEQKFYLEHANEKIICPDIDGFFPASVTPTVKWYQTCKLVDGFNNRYPQGPKLVISIVRSAYEGNYTCIVTFKDHGRTYNLTRTVMMKVVGSPNKAAGRKRKKPVPKSPKPPPPEGVKSNPSKRHRDRLNQELNKLTGLLPFPEDVCTRLDKLSILRLVVGYLKVKSYLTAAGTGGGDCVRDQPRAPGGNRRTHLQVNRELFPEGDLLLQALNGFVITVTGDGYIFYVSPTVQNYLGFHQSDLIYQSIFELIHTDDRAAFRCQLHQAVPDGCSTAGSPQHCRPERLCFVERSFTCRLRCLLDNSSGFLALNFRGRLKLLPGQQKRASLVPPPLALFAIATPLQPLSILELRTKTLMFQTKHKLDFTPTACDSRGKVILGYTETELCRRGSGYQFVHAADMMHCAEKHVRMMKTGESGLTVFRLLTKKGTWVWVQANARLVYKGGQPDFIIARQRALSNEEGEEHLRKRNLQLPFSFATGEAVLYGNNLPDFLDSFQAKEEFQTKTEPRVEQHAVDPNSILGAMMKQDASIYISHTDDVPQFSLPDLDAEPDGPSRAEKASDAKEDSDSLLVVIETLFEKSKVDGNICQTLQSLNVDNVELQQWEDTLLSLGAEESPSQDLGESVGSEVSSYVEQMLSGEGAGRSTDFSCSSASSCSEQGSSAAHFQHCWATNLAAPLAFQDPPQPQASGAQGQGALQLANPGKVFQAGLSTSVPRDSALPKSQSQSTCALMALSCPPPLDSSALVTRWHDIPVWTNPALTLGQSVSLGGCPSDAWVAAAPKELETAGAPLESQAAMASSTQSSPGDGLWLLPPGPAPCPAQGVCEHLPGEDTTFPAPPGASQLPAGGGFPKQPLGMLPAQLGSCWGREQAVFGEDEWSQHQGLVLGTSPGAGSHQRDHTVPRHCGYGNSAGLFRHEGAFLKDATKTSMSQPVSCHPGAPAGSGARCSASLPMELGVTAASCQPGTSFPPASSAGGRPHCACRVQLKVRCEGCGT